MLLVRLFDEALDPPHDWVGCQRLAGMDIAVAGRRMVGWHAECDDLASLGRDAGPGAEFRELRSLLENVVGRQHRDQCFGVLRRRPGGSRADGRGAVASLRLEQDSGLGADLLQLLCDAEAVVEIGDDDRRLEDRPVADQADDRLEGRPVADQRNELFGQALA